MVIEFNNEELTTSEELISIEDMCDILKCGQNAAYNLLRQHKVPCFKQGRIWKIPKRGVYEYIRKQSGLAPFSDETTTKMNPFIEYKRVSRRAY